MGYIDKITDNVFFKRNIDFKYISIPSISRVIYDSNLKVKKEQESVQIWFSLRLFNPVYTINI